MQTIPGPLHHSDLRARQAHATGGTRSSGRCPWSHSPRPAPHPVAPAGASGGSARPSWGPAPSAWTFSHPRDSFGRTSRRGKPGPRRRGRRRLRRTSHCIGSRRARVAPATSRPPPGRRAASASAEAPGRRGGTNGQGRGRKAVSTRSPRPRPTGASGPPLRHGARSQPGPSLNTRARPRGDLAGTRAQLRVCAVTSNQIAVSSPQLRACDPAPLWAASAPGKCSPQ